MRKVIIIYFIIIFCLSCEIHNKEFEVKKSIKISDVDRELISGLNNPTVSYILFKDGEEFLSEVDMLLLESGGTYVLNLNLLSGSTYTFEEFTISSNSEKHYILDAESINNTDGFSISSDGVFSVTPKVFLKKVTDIIFNSLEYESLSVEIITDESSFLDPVNLSFKVSSNITNATFKIYKYTIYWVSGPILEQDEIYDMDTGNIFDPLIEGDDDPWGSGKFKIETTNSLGETVFVVGFSDEWSKKHIHLTLD